MDANGDSLFFDFAEEYDGSGGGPTGKKFKQLWEEVFDQEPEADLWIQVLKAPVKNKKKPFCSAKSPQRNTRQLPRTKNLSLFHERGLYPTQTLKQGFVNPCNVARTKSAIDFFIRYVRLFSVRDGEIRSALGEDKRIFS